jgi:hypothetical protein
VIFKTSWVAFDNTRNSNDFQVLNLTGAFMKTPNFQKSFLTIITVIGLGLSALTVAAQNSPVAAAPQLSYGVPQIIQLAQAKISDDTIIAYIHNSGNSYGLDVNQIIYLRQQGVSDNVINVMLNQPKVASAPVQSATQPDNSQASTAYAQPATTYVQTVPSSQVYVIPDTQTYYYSAYYAQPYYYPYYAWPYPAVSLSFGFGGRWGGGGWHGGGFHGGGWHH